MNVVLNRMSVVNVGAAQTMIILTASTSSSDQSAPVISSLSNDEKREPDSASVLIFSNPTLTRLSDFRWQNPEKRDSGKCRMFSKWNAVREGRSKRYPIVEKCASGLFKWNWKSYWSWEIHPNFCRRESCLNIRCRLSQWISQWDTRASTVNERIHRAISGLAFKISRRSSRRFWEFMMEIERDEKIWELARR